MTLVSCLLSDLCKSLPRTSVDAFRYLFFLLILISSRWSSLRLIWISPVWPPLCPFHRSFHYTRISPHRLRTLLPRRSLFLGYHIWPQIPPDLLLVWIIHMKLQPLRYTFSFDPYRLLYSVAFFLVWGIGQVRSLYFRFNHRFLI